MVGIRGRRSRPTQRFSVRMFGATVASMAMVLGVLVGASPAGAQDAPPVLAPAFCGPILDLLDNNAFGVYLDDEDLFQDQLDESARLLVELRRVAPAELNGALDAVEAFWSSIEGEVSALGGAEALSEAQADDLSDRSYAVIEPVEDFYGQTCPAVNFQATLYPECADGDAISPPFLDVGNFSDDPIEATAGEVVFIVAADDYDFRDVSAELRAEDVLIDGVAGLVDEGSCAEFEPGPSEDDIRSYFAVTFTSGCPADSPPGLARLKIDLTEAGKSAIEEDLEEGYVEDGSEVFPLPIEVDDDVILGRFPAGLSLLQEADATAPEVKIVGVPVPVELREAECAPAPALAPSSGVAAAPLAPKFTG